MFGAELTGGPFRDMLVDFSGAFDLGEALARPGEACLLDVSMASGAITTFRFQFLSDGDGCLAVGGVDVTDHDRLQQELLNLNQELTNLGRELQQTNAELTRLNALKDQFLGMAAHDLRKPLGAILAYAGFLREEAQDALDEEQRGFLDAILDGTGRMRRLVDDFLDVAMIESGRLELARAPATLRETTDAATRVVGVVAAKKGVALDVSVLHGECSMQVDQPKLEQVLINLLGNAVEHSPAGSRVELQVTAEDGNAVFRVTDQGSGIPPEKLERLFEAFERAGTRKTAGERSVGLGLTIAKRIVEAHGGTIDVESRVGEGSVFTVTVPGNGGERDGCASGEEIRGKD